MANPGNSDHITREYFDSLLLEMRHIDGVKPDVKFELFGETFDTPIMMAALSHLNNTHPEGLAEQARGAKLANAVNWAGMGDKAELERITATGARTIKIIKPYENNEEVMDRIRHARECGVLALGIDVDHAFAGNGEYDNVFGLSMRPKSLTEIKEFVQEHIDSLKMEDLEGLSRKGLQEKYPNRAFTWRGPEVLRRNLRLMEEKNGN